MYEEKIVLCGANSYEKKFYIFMDISTFIWICYQK